MDNQGPRRLDLADLVIAVAFVALGMASLRLTLSTMTVRWFQGRQTRPGALGSTSLYFEMALAHGIPLLVLASLLVVALSLRRPGRPLRRLARSTGVVVPLAASVASGLTVAVLGA